MIIIINGPCGIGKTSVAWELNALFDRAVMLDGDYIGAVQPFEIYDQARIDYLYQTLRHLVAYHMDQGQYHNFVINYVFESPESLAKLRHLLSTLDDEIYAFRLTASDDAIEARIRKREQESDADLRWHLERYKELNTIQEQAAARGDMGFVIDTGGCSARQVADQIWRNLGEAVVLEPYNPAWEKRFESERALIFETLQDLALEIHHIGSTAIPGLDAKPIIDTMVVVRHLDDATQCISALQKIGYTFVDHPENVDRRFFRKGLPRTHHLHIVAAGSATMADHLAFRDALRADPALRDQYQELKYTLAIQYKHERSQYSERKSAFVDQVLAGWKTRQP